MIMNKLSKPKLIFQHYILVWDKNLMEELIHLQSMQAELDAISQMRDKELHLVKQKGMELEKRWEMLEQ